MTEACETSPVVVVVGETESQRPISTQVCGAPGGCWWTRVAAEVTNCAQLDISGGENCAALCGQNSEEEEG